MGAKKTNHAALAGGVAGLIAAVVAFFVVSNGIKTFLGGNSVERQIEKLTEETNRQLPMQVDEFTRWDRMDPGPGKSFSYIYTVSVPLNEEQKQAVREDTTRKALAAPEMQVFFDAGITVWYKYYDASGNMVLEFSVTKGD